MKTKLVVLTLLATLNPQLSTVFAQGSLSPSGSPAPTMKTLAQIEPRTPISSAPFTITNAGSYYLTTNLTGSPGGITIAANGVTLDLMGFELAGGTGHGITVSGTRTNVVIRRGVVRGWSTNGISAGSAVNSVVEDVRVSDNGGSGIGLGEGGRLTHCQSLKNGNFGMFVGSAGVVTECGAMQNTLDGINTGIQSTIKDSVAASNQGLGFAVGDRSTIHGCSSALNQQSGISVGPYCTVANCTTVTNGIYGISVNGGACTIVNCSVMSNTSTGMVVGAGSKIENCTVVDNAGMGLVATFGSTISRCTFRQNKSSAILVSSGCYVLENTCDLNGGNGIGIFGSGNRIEGNSLTANSYPGISCIGSSNLIAKNSARGNSPYNYSFVSGNRYGVILDLTSTATLAVGGNSAASTLSSTDPWANFSY